MYTRTVLTHKQNTYQVLSLYESVLAIIPLLLPLNVYEKKLIHNPRYFHNSWASPASSPAVPNPRPSKMDVFLFPLDLPVFLQGPWPKTDNKNKELMHCCFTPHRCCKPVNKLSITDIQF